jgi:hypothetical protein
MSGEERCDFTDMLVDQCAHCTGRTGDAAPSLAIVRTWVARYASRCAWCAGAILPGSLMGWDEEYSYVCERCLP